MRAPMASALLVAFGLVFFAHYAAAQSGPILSQAPQPQEKMLPAAKLLPFPPAIQIVLLPNQNGSANDPAITLQRAQDLRTRIQALQNRKDGSGLMRFGSAPDAPNCAHIQIIQAPEMDSEMVVQVSPGDGGPIQTFQGLPPCRRDLSAPMTVQRFYGAPPILPIPPRRPFVLPPVLQIPSAAPAPVKPKTDSPSRER